MRHRLDTGPKRQSLFERDLAHQLEINEKLVAHTALGQGIVIIADKRAVNLIDQGAYIVFVIRVPFGLTFTIWEQIDEGNLIRHGGAQGLYNMAKRRHLRGLRLVMQVKADNGRIRAIAFGKLGHIARNLRITRQMGKIIPSQHRIV